MDGKKMTRYPCHDKDPDQWCDKYGRGGFMGHTCQTPALPSSLKRFLIRIGLAKPPPLWF
jgi:hypothetical protein